MSKIRIYELAKKLGVANKIILNELSKLGIEGKTHSSSIEPEVARKIETMLLQKSGKPSGKTAPVKEAVTKTLRPRTEKLQEEQHATEAPREEIKTEREETETIVPEEKTEKTLTAPLEEEELKIPDRFKKEMETEKIEKFKAKPGMQRAFQTIRKIEPKRVHDQRSFRRGGKGRPFQTDDRRPQAQLIAPRKKTLKLQEGTTVKEFAELISVKFSDVIKKFMELGYMPTINQPVDADAALLIAENFGIKVELAPIEEDTVDVEAPEDLSNCYRALRLSP